MVALQLALQLLPVLLQLLHLDLQLLTPPPPLLLLLLQPLPKAPEKTDIECVVKIS